MKRVRKIVLFVVLILGIGIFLSGCISKYSKRDRIKLAEKKLSDKYGEEFHITEVFDYSDFSSRTFNTNPGPFSVYAYSVNHPDVIFMGHYDMGWPDKDGYDYYIEEWIAQQYTYLAEEQLNSLEYDYYINGDRSGSQQRETPLTDSTITIEEYNAITEEKYRRASIEIYITDTVLQESDEYIYETLKNVADQTECIILVLFMTNEDLTIVKSQFRTRADLTSSTQTYLSNNYVWMNSNSKTKKHAYLLFQSPAYEGKIAFEEFQEQMAVIRTDAGY